MRLPLAVSFSAFTPSCIYARKFLRHWQSERSAVKALGERSET